MRPRILYLVSEDWAFLSHRLPMARAARDAGYEVHVAARVSEGRARIKSEGFILHPLNWRRGSINPLHVLSVAWALRGLYRRLRPDIVHSVSVAPVFVGSIAALGLPIARLNALVGLGFIFTSRTLKARLILPLIRRLLAFLLRQPGATALVQNRDDEAMVERIGVPKNRIALIPGSGVDVDQLTPLPDPANDFTIGFVGRLLYDKGVETLVRAHDMLSQRGLRVRILFAGTPDPANPSSIPQPTLDRWAMQEGLEFLGQVGDIRTVWTQAHVAVLPSRREGLPKSLLEAAACGRAMIATDVPGCREIAVPGTSGLLVPPDDPKALADAIALLMNDRNLRLRLGDGARQFVVENLSSARIGREIVALYRSLRDGGTGSDAVRVTADDKRDTIR